LPDDGVINRVSGVAIPNDRGLALIGDADRSHIVWSRAGAGQCLKSDRNLGGSDLLGIMLDPSGLGKNLIELALRDRANGSFPIE
jgi:hypothetical protein